MSNPNPPLSEKLVLAVKSAEGFSLTAYLDSVGVWTIGYGHTPCREGDTCTQEQADAWLAQDLARAAKAAGGLPEARGLDNARLEALTELIFNLGPSRWALFVKTREAIADREWQTAHDELLNSKWAGQVGPKRSTRIALALLTGS